MARLVGIPAKLIELPAQTHTLIHAGDFLIVTQCNVGKPKLGPIRIAAHDEWFVGVAEKGCAEVRDRIDADITRQRTIRIGVQRMGNGEQVRIIGPKLG
jgi:hypothetical protein